MPRVSVVMPVYNCARYVSEAIDSILGQTFTDFEFIIIDDGSTDGTRALVEAAAAADPRIRLVSHENRGVTACLNEGLELAQGDLIARMDGDDIAMPDRFEQQVAFLDAHSDHALVGGQFVLVDPEGRGLRGLDRPTCHDALQVEFLKGITAVNHPTMMYRRESARSIGGYLSTISHAEDLDFLLRISETSKVANLDTCVLLYRLHLSSIGLTRRKEQVASQYRAVADAAKRRGLEPPRQPDARDPNRTLADVYMRWGWWALQGGEVRTARLYAVKAFIRRPISRASLRLLACSLRGY